MLFRATEMAQDGKTTPRRSARLAHAGSALKKLTTTAVKTIDDFVPLELTGNTKDKWMKMRANCDDDDDFKETVIKDAETVSLVSALVLTIAFAALLAPVKEAPQRLRLAYLCSVFLGISFSLIGCIIAVRTIMLLNSIQEDRTIEALKAVSNYRLHPSLNAFNFTGGSLLWLLVSSVLFMACEYGTDTTEVHLSAGIFILTGFYIGHVAGQMDRVGEEIRGSKRGYV